MSRLVSIVFIKDIFEKLESSQILDYILNLNLKCLLNDDDLIFMSRDKIGLQKYLDELENCNKKRKLAANTSKTLKMVMAERQPRKKPPFDLGTSTKSNGSLLPAMETLFKKAMKATYILLESVL